jgi:hypothetical protein
MLKTLLSDINIHRHSCPPPKLQVGRVSESMRLEAHLKGSRNTLMTRLNTRPQPICGDSQHADRFSSQNHEVILQYTNGDTTETKPLPASPRIAPSSGSFLLSPVLSFSLSSCSSVTHSGARMSMMTMGGRRTINTNHHRVTQRRRMGPEMHWCAFFLLYFY